MLKVQTLQLLIIGIIATVMISACAKKEELGPAIPNSGYGAGSGDSKELDGKRIYKLNCITCHGAKGNMGASGAHDLTESTLSLKERITVITKGREQMAAYEGVLSKEQIKAVAKYVETFRE